MVAFCELRWYYNSANCEKRRKKVVVSVELLKIKARMVEKGMNQSRLATELGVGVSTISQKLNNERRITINEARKIQKILQIADEDFCKYFF